MAALKEADSGDVIDLSPRPRRAGHGMPPLSLVLPCASSAAGASAPPAARRSRTPEIVINDDDDDKGGANGDEDVALLPSPSSKKRKRALPELVPAAAGRGGRSAPPAPLRRADDDVVEVEEVPSSSKWARGGGGGRGSGRGSRAPPSPQVGRKQHGKQGRGAGGGGGERYSRRLGSDEEYEDEDYLDGDWGRPPPPRAPAGGGGGSTFSQIMGFLATAFQGGGAGGGMPPPGLYGGGGGGWVGGGVPAPQYTAAQLQAMPPAQRLRSLQAMGREFTPEDYELLSMLDEKPAAAADDMEGALVQSRLARLPLSRMPDRRKGKRAGAGAKAREAEVIVIASQGGSAAVGGEGEVIALDESVEEAEGGHELCPICREDLPPGSVVKALPCCLQAFHPDCIDQWFAVSAGRCPVCKADMLRFT